MATPAMTILRALTEDIEVLAKELKYKPALSAVESALENERKIALAAHKVQLQTLTGGARDEAKLDWAELKRDFDRAVKRISDAHALANPESSLSGTPLVGPIAKKLQADKIELGGIANVTFLWRATKRIGKGLGIALLGSSIGVVVGIAEFTALRTPIELWWTNKVGVYFRTNLADEQENKPVMTDNPANPLRQEMNRGKRPPGQMPELLPEPTPHSAPTPTEPQSIPSIPQTLSSVERLSVQADFVLISSTDFNGVNNVTSTDSALRERLNLRILGFNEPTIVKHLLPGTAYQFVAASNGDPLIFEKNGKKFIVIKTQDEGMTGLIPLEARGTPKASLDNRGGPGMTGPGTSSEEESRKDIAANDPGNVDLSQQNAAARKAVDPQQETSTAQLVARTMTPPVHMPKVSLDLKPQEASGGALLAATALALPLELGVRKAAGSKLVLSTAEKFLSPSMLGKIAKFGARDGGVIGDLTVGAGAFAVGWYTTGKVAGALDVAADTSDSFTMVKGIKERKGHDIAAGAGSLIASGATLVLCAGALAAGGWVALGAIALAGVAGYVGKQLFTLTYDKGIEPHSAEIKSGFHKAADTVTSWFQGNNQVAPAHPTFTSGSNAPGFNMA